MSIQLLDIYSNNRVNFEQEKATGTDGIFLKGGQGEWPDVPRVHPEWFDQIDALDIPRGIYWQMDARISPEKHKAAIKRLFPDGNFGKLGLWLAVELPFYPLPDFMYWRFPYAGYKMIESVWRGVFAYTGKYPGIYTSISKWNLIFGACPLSLQAEFAEESKLWVAQYKVAQPSKIGAWGEDYTFWQYTENPDYNVYKGTEAEFRFEFGIGESAPAPLPVPDPVPTPDNPFDVLKTYELKTLRNGEVKINEVL